ncbi:nuclear transport factor 2 family protein [Ruania alkalisoli]|uniref:Nuclear transport factor 2 family protein n=1 Tax=Ruania alkalisoli TaxID=2779775 RepID=A0A7M1SUV6_9MICO|nr:nuclear transport factor 2 family protein [Ruania alkalisoli]QOR71338.1 nuclear transport factor 2 family protein [Ruania alkalisoli]
MRSQNETDAPSTTASESEPFTVLRRLHEALESGGHGEQLRELFVPEAELVERPNVLKPDGATATVGDMIAASTAGASLLAVQRYAVHSCVAAGDEVAVRLTWEGEVAADAGPFRRGQVLTAHIAQFATVRDGRIVRLETFDCYEPFDR